VRSGSGLVKTSARGGYGAYQLQPTVQRLRGGEGDQSAVRHGTTQNDIIKEHLTRGTYAFPLGPSARLIADTVEHVPSWNAVS
jgi:methylmalonyl-CoA mutase N-terminal domain/subunit